MLAGAAGCGGGAADAVTSTVQATGAGTARMSNTDGTTMPTRSPDPTAPPASSHRPGPTTAAPPPPRSSRALGSTTSPATTASAASTARTSTANRPTVVVLSADAPTVPGPDRGPACSVARQFSDEAPTGLREAVVAGWLATRHAAARQGITLCLNDGKRSRAQQLATFDSYVEQYGTALARQYVLPPGKSAHVAGYAVDVQPARAYTWLQATAGKWGFCRIYDNEPWHFEYSTRYLERGCPARLDRPRG